MLVALLLTIAVPSLRQVADFDTRPFTHHEPLVIASDGTTAYVGLWSEDEIAVLYATDGTTNGTRPIYFDTWSPPLWMQVLRGKLLVARYDLAVGAELFVSGGSRHDLTLVRDLDPGFEGYGFIAPGVALDGAAYFAGRDPEHGIELWKTDGTASGTQRLADRIDGGEISDLTRAGGLVFFIQSAELWVSNGTDAGTRMVHSPANRILGAAGDWIYFVSSDDDSEGLFVSRGESAVQLLEADIGTGAGDHTNVCFVALAPDSNLYCGDASTNLTLIAPLPDFARMMAVSGATSFLTVMAPQGRMSLWASDSETGTRQLSEGLLIQSPFVHEGWLYFAAENQVWATDGVGFRAVASHSSSNYGAQLGAAGGKPIFLDPDGRLAIIDDPRGEARTIAELAEGPTLGSARITATAGDRIIVATALEVIGTDGDRTETLLPGSVREAQSGSLAYLVLEPGTTLAVTDGTAAGTRIAREEMSWRIERLESLGDRLVFFSGDAFTAYDPVTDAMEMLPVPVTARGPVRMGQELIFVESGGIWSSDGTAKGTVQRSAQPLGEVRYVSAGPDRLFFASERADEGYDLWFASSDLTSALPIAVVGDLYSAPVVQGTLVFLRTESGLVSSDGTAEGTYTLTEERTSTAIVEHGGVFYFGIPDAEHGEELWRTDGTREGTMLSKDFYPGPGSSRALPYSSGGRLFFTAITPEHGWEIRTESHELLFDTLPGYASLMPFDLHLIGDRLYFVGTSPEHGAELWVIEDLDPIPGESGLELATESCGCRTSGSSGSLGTLLFLTLLALRPRLRG